jgi:hypothetical protein
MADMWRYERSKRPSSLRSATVRPDEPTFPANVIVPPTAATTRLPTGAPMSMPLCWPPAYGLPPFRYGVRTGPLIGHVQPAAEAVEQDSWTVAASADMKVIGRMRATVGGVADRKAMAVTVPLRVVTRACDLSLFCHTMGRFCNAAGARGQPGGGSPTSSSGMTRDARSSSRTPTTRDQLAGSMRPCDPDRVRQEARQAAPRVRRPTDLPSHPLVEGHPPKVVRVGPGLPSSASWRTRNGHPCLTLTDAPCPPGSVAQRRISGRMTDGSEPGRAAS